MERPVVSGGAGSRVRPVRGVALVRERSGDRLLYQSRQSGHWVGGVTGLAAAAGRIHRRRPHPSAAVPADHFRTYVQVSQNTERL